MAYFTVLQGWVNLYVSLYILFSFQRCLSFGFCLCIIPVIMILGIFLCIIDFFFFFPVWLLLQALNFQPIYFLDWSQLRCFIDISHLQWLNQNICTQPHDMFLICSYHGVHSRLLEVSFDTSICPKYQQVLLDVCQYILKLCMLCPSNHHFSSQSL